MSYTPEQLANLDAELAYWNELGDLLKEIMADPGNKLFGKPLSEIQRMICVEESLGSPSRTILLAALELAVAELNEWNDTYNMKRETPEDWIKTAEEALKEKPE